MFRENEASLPTEIRMEELEHTIEMWNFLRVRVSLSIVPYDAPFVILLWDKSHSLQQYF